MKYQEAWYFLWDLLVTLLWFLFSDFYALHSICLFLEVPAAVLECLGIAGNCKLTSLDAIMQLGMVAVIATLITNFQKNAPLFSRLIVVCVCGFALLNIFYTYKDCITTTDNLTEYEEVIDYMQSKNIEYGYAEFCDASRITIMTDGDITMGHSYQMEDLCMYWWTTSTKWYVPNLPTEMKTAYVVKSADKDGFLAQFEDPTVMTLGFENDRFAVYISDYNYVGMQ